MMTENTSSLCPSAANRATIPAVTTVIGPVGPVICDGVPPNRAAKKPQKILPYKPANGPRPEATPKAKARGRATTAVVTPARSVPKTL